MVYFNIIYHSDTEIRYEYFPENDKNSTAGIIGIDKQKKEISLLQPAERDYEVAMVTPTVSSGQNKGLRLVTDENTFQDNNIVPLNANKRYYLYAHHAIKKIQSTYCMGCIIKSDKVAW